MHILHSRNLSDRLCSVVALSNENREIAERYSYDVYGDPTIKGPGDEPRVTSDVNNPYLFTGRQYDAETGLYSYRARYYKPSIGRFLQTDPIYYEDGLNLYAYCLNNPIKWTDPWGLDIWVENDPEIGYGLHQRICIGNPNGYFEAYSFGLDSEWHILIPFRTGSIYRDWNAHILGHRGRILRNLRTTRKQDEFAREALRKMENERLRYGVDNNCRTFSNDMFDILSEQFGETPKEKKSGQVSQRTSMPADPANVGA